MHSAITSSNARAVAVAVATIDRVAVRRGRSVIAHRRQASSSSAGRLGGGTTVSARCGVAASAAFATTIAATSYDSSPRRRRAIRASATDADADTETAVEPVTPIAESEGWAKLDQVLGDIKKLPPSERAEAAEGATKTVSTVLNGMKAGGATSRWDCYPELVRRNIFPNELSQMGVKDPSSIGRPSNTNDFNFIVAVTMSTSFLALIVGVVLPGDWGAFGRAVYLDYLDYATQHIHAAAAVFKPPYLSAITRT